MGLTRKFSTCITKAQWKTIAVTGPAFGFRNRCTDARMANEQAEQRSWYINKSTIKMSHWNENSRPVVK